MKKVLIALLTVGCSLIGTAGEVFQPDFQPVKYDVRPSELVPRWSGAQAGEWTFDYDAALAGAQANGKYTLLLFSGMWWCPHCQPLEKHVLLDESFQEFVRERGFYLTVLDFPYRDGIRNWCWLWDPAYRQDAGIGDWTPTRVSDELIRRFGFQDAWSKGGAETTNLNVLVEISQGQTNLTARTDAPTTVYRRVSYPTIIVVKPDGTEAGRFGFNKSIAPEDAVDYVENNIRLILNGSDLFKDPAAGGFQGMASEQYVGWLEDALTGEVAGTFTAKTGKGNKRTHLAKVSVSVKPMADKKISLSGTCMVPAANGLVELADKKNTAVAMVRIGTDGFVGTFFDASGHEYALKGGRDVFKDKDSAAKARAAGLRTGFWTLADTRAASAAFKGANGFSAAVKAKAKSKVSGVMGDGTKVSVSAQGVMGDDGILMVPVVSSKKNAIFSYLLRFQNGLLVSASDGLVHGAAAGIGSLPAENLRFEVGDLDVPEKGLAGESLSVEFAQGGKKWQGEGRTDENYLPCKFSLSLDAKTGLLKGKLEIQVPEANGKPKKVKANLFGVVVNGIGEGTVVFPKVGSKRFRITSACGGEGC